MPSIDELVGRVSLPKNFIVGTREEAGRSFFNFSSPVELPLSTSALKEYKNRMFALRDSTRYGPIIYLALQETLPEFIGKDDFYKLCHSDILPNDARLILMKKDSDGLGLACLDINIKGDFFPRAEPNMPAVKPTVEWGSIEANVNLPFYIPYPGKERIIFAGDISTLIGVSLVYGKELTLEDNPVVRYDLVFNQGVTPHIQVLNPTIERITGAISRASEIREFFQQNNAVLQEIAQLASQAKSLESSAKCMKREYDSLVEKYAEAKAMYPRIQKPTNIGRTLKGISEGVRSKLEAGTEKLRPLFEFFPKGILDYATAEGYKMCWVGCEGIRIRNVGE